MLLQSWSCCVSCQKFLTPCLLHYLRQALCKDAWNKAVRQALCKDAWNKAKRNGPSTLVLLRAMPEAKLPEAGLWLGLAWLACLSAAQLHERLSVLF